MRSCDSKAVYRHAVRLCTLLANQARLVRNTFLARVALVRHLFSRVLPLPLPLPATAAGAYRPGVVNMPTS